MYFGMQDNDDNTFTYVNHVYLNGLRIVAIQPNGKAFHYLTNQVDSVIVDDGGKALSRFDYYDYGETWIEEGDDKFSPQYGSQCLDKESGFIFMNARHYDGEIARFVTADNVVPEEKDTQSWNSFLM